MKMKHSLNFKLYLLYIWLGFNKLSTLSSSTDITQFPGHLNSWKHDGISFGWKIYKRLCTKNLAILACSEAQKE